MSEFMGSTGADFPSWAQDASFDSLRAEETMLRQDGVAEWITGWPETAFITDPDTGIRYAVPGRRISSDVTGGLWGLDVQTASNLDTGVRIINPGTVGANSAYNSAIEISNPTEILNISVNDFVWLELTLDEGGEFQLEYKFGQEWPGYPNLHDVEASGVVGVYTVKSYSYPLWQFVDTRTTTDWDVGLVKYGAGRRIGQQEHFEVVETVLSNPTSTGEVIWAHRFMPSYKRIVAES